MRNSSEHKTGRMVAVLFALLVLPALLVGNRAFPCRAAEPTTSVPDPPTHRLTDIATRQPRFRGDFYGWLSTAAVLLARPDRDHPRGVLFQHELTSGRELALPALTTLYNQADGGSILQISPDGQWVLWWTGKSHEVAIHGARLDGSGHFQVPKAKAEWDNLYLFWMADSRRFVELAMPEKNRFTRAILRNVEKPEEAEIVPIRESNPLQSACAVAGRDIALAQGDLLISLPCALSGYGPVEPVLKIGVTAILNPSLRADGESPLTAPCKINTFCGAALSARSDRIAWLTAEVSNRGETRVALCVSRLDGSRWTEIGFERTVKPDIGFGEHLEQFLSQSPGTLHWLPDGKTLSFFYKGDFYTVPAPDLRP